MAPRSLSKKAPCLRTLPVHEASSTMSLDVAESSSSAPASPASRSSSSIPVIDLGDPVVASIAAQIARACETVGFFAIVNHGLEEKEEEESRSGSRCSVVERAWTASREFFDLPLEEKLLCKSADEKVYPYGFECSERLSRGKKAAAAAAETAAATCQEPPEKPPPEEEGGDGVSADLKETFSIGPCHPGAGMPPRAFPARPPDLRTALESYYEAMEGLASKLLRLFAMALHLPSEDWFEPLLTRHLSALRILNYREIQRASAGVSSSSNCSAPPLLVRAGEHTDYGALTILRSGGPGLQLRKDRVGDGESGDAGAWVDVPDIPGAFVVNIGDMMQRWTNDRWVSTLHRVVVDPSSWIREKETQEREDAGRLLSFRAPRRQSIAYFCQVNGDAVISSLPSCGPPKYPPITAREHIMKKHLASMGAAP